MDILGIGYAHADNIIDNKFLEDLDIGTSAAWIEEKIGIITRLTTLPLDYIRTTRNLDPRMAREVALQTPTELGLKATHMALARAGIKPEQLGMVICNCCTPNQVAPAESQRIAGALNLRIPAFDVFTACPAFALHVDFLNRFREDAVPEYVLCVSTAALTQNVNYNDRSDGAIWGDGAAAWVISNKHEGKLKVIEASFASDPTRCQAVVVERYGHFHQDGRAVRDFSVRQTVRLVKQLESSYNLDWTRDIFIGHQANATMLQQICNNRDIPNTNHWQNVSSVGNQAGAGAPAVLGRFWDQIVPNQKIAVAVVGAGLSWGTVLMQGR